MSSSPHALKVGRWGCLIIVVRLFGVFGAMGFLAVLGRGLNGYRGEKCS